MKEYRLTTDTVSNSISILEEILTTTPQKLRLIPADEFNRRPAPGKWSQKEIIGHLIDSATNNHHRFIRAQFEEKPLIIYDQEKWNEYGYYNSMDGRELITFWELYNRRILELIRRMPEDMLLRECRMAEGGAYSVGWLFDDYVRHLEHHLRQIDEMA
jgi:hypothetical protein